MRKSLLIQTTLLLLASSVTSANAFDYATSPGFQIVSTTSSSPSISAGGSQFYPVTSKLIINGNLDFLNVAITNNAGEAIEVDPNTGIFQQEIKYTDSYVLEGVYMNGRSIVPVMLQGPMDIGHINFDNASAALDKNDKAVLRAMAKEVVDTDLKAIYMVGKSDATGTDAQNFAISEKRVQAAKNYLQKYLDLYGATGVIITTESMGDLSAVGVHNKPNAEDRRVDVTIYPKI